MDRFADLLLNARNHSLDHLSISERWAVRPGVAIDSPTPDEIDGMRKDGYGGWFWLDFRRPTRLAIKVPKHTPQDAKHV
jgi:hypothetical protein